MYWNTALKPTPNFPIFMSSISLVGTLFFEEKPIAVIALMWPSLLFILSSSAFSGSDTVNLSLPLWVKINWFFVRTISTSVAFASSAFWRSSYIKCAESQYLSITPLKTFMYSGSLKTPRAFLRLSWSALNQLFCKSSDGVIYLLNL